MTGYDLLFLLGGFALGIVATVLFRKLLRFLENNGEVAVDSATCVEPNILRITGKYTLLNGCKLIKLLTHVDNGDPNAEPPPDAMHHEPQANGVFTLDHTFSGPVPASGRAVVWGLFAKHHGGELHYVCGSGSGSTIHIGLAVTEPAARDYRLVVGDAAEAGATPEVQRALARREAALAHDPQRSGPHGVVWVEQGVPTGEPLRWRLVVRRANGTDVATLELAGGSGPALVWVCRQWHATAVSRFVADPAHAASRTLPGVEVHPA